jgi:HEAT repeat protein
MAGLLAMGCGSSKQDEIAGFVTQEGGYKTGDEKIAKEKSVDELVSIALKGKSVRDRMVALTALGYHKNDPKATQALLDVFAAAKEPNDSYFALISLARIGAPETKGAIEKTLQGTDAYLRESAIQAIGLLGDKSLYPLVFQALDDAQQGVRVAAAHVVKEYKLEESTE